MVLDHLMLDILIYSKGKFQKHTTTTTTKSKPIFACHMLPLFLGLVLLQVLPQSTLLVTRIIKSTIIPLPLTICVRTNPSTQCKVLPNPHYCNIKILTTYTNGTLLVENLKGY
jgi:hypothetical protein